MIGVAGGLIVALVLIWGLSAMLRADFESGRVQQRRARPLWKDIVLILVLYFVIRKLLEYRYEVEN